MYELLTKKPEGEARLLSGITNKLGDPSRKIASNAGFLLSQLLMSHPGMKPVVLREVRERGFSHVLLRFSPHCRHAICPFHDPGMGVF